jgi:LysM repeat protein
MRTPVLVVIVVLLHAAAIGSLFFIQGCGTTKDTSMPSHPPVIPEPVIEQPMLPPAGLPETPPPKPVVKHTAPVETTETVEYVVKPGDMLSKIAVRYKVSVKQITDLNKISNPNAIRAGQKLIIPVRPGVTLHQPEKPKAAPTAKKSSAVVGPNEYVVQAGDTLSGIARRYQTKVSTLCELNNLNSDRIKVGQKLRVAGAASEPAKPTPAATTTPDTISAPEMPAAMEPTPEATAVSAPEVAPAPETPAYEPEAAVPFTGQEIVHVVQANEDLEYIARLYVVSVDDIVKLNSLPEPKVQIGQRLRIP